MYFFCLKGVRVVQVDKRYDYAPRFVKVEVRIGNADESNVQGDLAMSRNPLFGYFEGPEEAVLAIITNEDGADGRYLTLQTFSRDVLELEEVYIYFLVPV